MRTRADTLPGRESELQSLRTALTDNRCVVVTGAAGIGKSALLAVVGAERGVDIVVATATAGATPFAALAGLVDPPRRADAHGVRQVAQQIRDRGVDLVVVDDAHLLDLASAAALHHWALAGGLVLAALRDDVPRPDAIDAIGDLGLVVEVPALDEAGVREMAEQLLGGIVDRGAAVQLAASSQGVPLWLDELVRAARADHTLRLRQSVWVLTSRPGAPPSVRALVHARLNLLSAAARELVELVALAEPVPLDRLLGLSTLDAADEAEATGFVVLRGAPPAAWLAHPVLGEVAVELMTGAQRVMRLQSLVDGWEAYRDAAAPGDPAEVAACSWALAIGRPVAVERLLAAAAIASTAAPDTAVRLLQAAIDRGAGLEAQLALAELLAHAHRGADALTILTAIDLTGLTDDEIARLAVTRALALSFGPQQPGQALAVLDEASERIGPHPMLEVGRVTALFRAGEMRQAADLAATLETWPLPPIAAAQVTLSGTGSLFYAGRIADGARMLERGRAGVEAIAEVMPEATGSLGLFDAWVSRFNGDLPREELLAEAGYERALREANPGERAQYAQLLGWNLTLQGRPGEGVGWLTEACAGSGVWWDATSPWLQSMLVITRSIVGDLDGAAVLLAELQQRHRSPLYDGDVGLAHAAVLAAQGAVAAGPTAVRAARSAHSLGIDMVALHGFYDGFRYGDKEARAGVEITAAVMSTPYSAALAAHAAATNGSALESAAWRLHALCLNWYAAEAMASALQWHRRRRQPGAAVMAELGLRRILAETVGLRTPPLVDRHWTLTERESAVVALAAAGRTDREIADELEVGVRTVQSHLTNAYAKLGVHSRSELVIDPGGESAT